MRRRARLRRRRRARRAGRADEDEGEPADPDEPTDEAFEECVEVTWAYTDQMQTGSCAGLPFGSDAMTCLAGVEMLCGCVEGTDVACTAEDRAAFEAECGNPSSTDFAMFVCMGGTSSCSEAAELCIPDA